MFVLFSTEGHDVFTEKMLSLLFIDIITTLFTKDMAWLLIVYKLATRGHRLPLDTTYTKASTLFTSFFQAISLEIPYTKAMNVPRTGSVRDGAELCRDFKQGIQQGITSASWNHPGDKHLNISLLFPGPLRLSLPEAQSRAVAPCYPLHLLPISPEV